MKKSYLYLSLVLLLLNSCTKEKASIEMPLDPVEGLVSSENDDFPSLTTLQKQQLTDNALLLLGISDSIIKEIANSSMTTSQINNMTESSLISNGVTTANIISARTDSMNSSLQSILSIVGSSEECSTCEYDSLTTYTQLKLLAKLYRDDPSSYDTQMDSLAQRIAVSLDDGGGPRCNWAFYVCLAVGSGATSGIAAAAAIYLCACSFCEVKPPGC